MIQMENVTYSYEKGYGIKNVNFTIDDSEFTFLIGPTGSGKTTIMKLIYMALIPQSGVVTTGKFRSDKIKKRNIPFLRRKIDVQTPCMPAPITPTEEFLNSMNRCYN